MSRALVMILFVSLTSIGCSAGAPHWQAPHPGWLVVSDETGGNLVLVDPERGTVEGRVAIGKRPRGVRVSRDGTQILAALSGSPIAGPGVDESTLPPADRSADGIGVLDARSGKVLRTLTSGADPETFDISPDGAIAYVSNEDTGELSAIDVAAGTIRGRVGIGPEPEGVTVSADGGTVYVTCEGDNTVYAIDTAALAVRAKIETGARPRAIAVTRDGATVLITTENGGMLSVVDGRTAQRVADITIPEITGAPTAPRPMGIALSADERRAYVSLGRAGAIAVIDVANRRVEKIITGVGARPWGIAISADGRTLFTANGPSGDVAVIDIAAGRVTRQIAVGGSPWGVAVLR
jgi:YVTN family beta-propeller protein